MRRLTALGIAFMPLLSLSRPVGAQAQPSQAEADMPVRSIITRAQVLSAAQQAATSRNPALSAAVARLVRDAEKYAAQPMVSVTDKRTILPPSGDTHDYLSLSPYWWPDPGKPDGLPYIRRDGETNSESKRDLDQPRIAMLGERVQVFTLAWWLTGDRKWSDLAIRQVRTWFVDPATRMTPHLRYAQLVRGNPAERGSGIIDSRSLIEVVDAIGMLERAPGWTPADRKVLEEWFSAYGAWLRDSPNGKHERAAVNNHGSWFSAQAAAYAVFVGDTATARAEVLAVRERIATQISADGTQPEEMARTRSLHYHNFNLEALSRLAEIGRLVNVDLWNYEAPRGGSLRVSIERMAPFIVKQADWPGQQLDAVNFSDLLRTLRRAQLAYGASFHEAALRGLPADLIEKDRSRILFWRSR